jgi:mono/diheme cytochrome c family protein
MKTKAIYLIMLALGTIALLAFAAPTQDQKIGEPWDIPTEYREMVNPYKGQDLDRLGRSAYSRHCRSCHGNAGLGDGPRARNLVTFPGDFSSKEFQAYTDGEIYYMSIIGRDEMPNYESAIPDMEERWAIVNYIRTMAK